MCASYKKLAMLAGASVLTAIFMAPAFADEPDLTQRCEALAMRFRAADVSHLVPEKLEAARRQANHGEHLCKSSPQVGLKAINLALRDIGDAAI